MKHAVVGVVVGGAVKPFAVEHLLSGCVLRVMSVVTESNNFDVQVPSIEQRKELQGKDVYTFPNGAEAPRVGRRYGFAELVVDHVRGSTTLRLEDAEKIIH